LKVWRLITIISSEFQGVVQDQLFDKLQKVAEEDNSLPEGMNMRMIMEEWTKTTGFPLVRVSRADETRIYVSQVIS